MMRYLLVMAIVLSGCGTHDYKSKPKTEEPSKTENQTPATTKSNNRTGARSSNSPTLFERTAKEGPFWEWTAGNPITERMKCTLRDGSEANYLQALGYQVFGGIVLGLIYKAAGAYYLGRPVPPTSDRAKALPVGPPNVSGWAWERIYMDSERFEQGVWRGVGLTVGCAHLLGPGIFFVTDGLLGRDFNSLATGIAIGLSGAGAIQPYLNYFARGGFGNPIENVHLNKGVVAHAIRTLSSKIGSGDRKSLMGRAILPNLTAVTFGGTLGYIVYRRVHHAPDTEDDSKLDCEKYNAASKD